MTDAKFFEYKAEYSRATLGLNTLNVEIGLAFSEMLEVKVCEYGIKKMNTLAST